MSDEKPKGKMMVRDHEIQAMAALDELLCSLTPDQRLRVLAWANSRYTCNADKDADRG